MPGNARVPIHQPTLALAHMWPYCRNDKQCHSGVQRSEIGMAWSVW